MLLHLKQGQFFLESLLAWYMAENEKEKRVGPTDVSDLQNGVLELELTYILLRNNFPFSIGLVGKFQKL